ncbi:hypothetical protein ACVBGC_01390 [Burkholderia stagnalis]
MAANITITVSPSTTTPTDFGNSETGGAPSASQPSNFMMDPSSLAALVKQLIGGGSGGTDGAGGSGGIGGAGGGLGGAGQGLHNVKLSSDKGTVQVQMDSQGNIYDKSGKSIGKQNSDGSITFDSGKNPAAEILETGSTNGKHQPQGRETIGADDVSVSAGDLRSADGSGAGGGGASSIPVGTQTIPSGAPEGSGSSAGNYGTPGDTSSAGGGNNINIGVGNSPTGGQTITISLGDGSSPSSGAGQADGATPDGGLGGAGQGLHNVKFSTDKGTVQLQMDDQGNLYDKSGKSVGKQNADGSLTFDSGKSTAAEILNSGSTNGKHQPQGRETIAASDVSASAGDLRGSAGEASDSARGSDVEALSQAGFSANPKGQTVTV